ATGPAPTRYAPTARGLDLLCGLTALQGEAITALWSPHQAILPALLSLATRAADGAAATLPRDRYPAFHGQYAAPDPPAAPPAHALGTRLPRLRSLRAAAHARAWAARRLDAAQAGAFTLLWHDVATSTTGGDDTLTAALEELRRHGLAILDG